MVETAIANFLRRHAISDQPIVLAVSGGADSLALLHAVARQLPADRIIVAHLNHQLRAADADDDADFVAAAAAERGCAVVIERRDVAAIAAAGGRSLEEAARHERYRFLAAVARQHAARWVLTGHNADDQAETVLMHLLRGSGLSGLGGMRPVTPLPYANPDDAIALGRPLLDVPRSAINAFCADWQLTPRIDASNLNTHYTRNRIRHTLLPQIEAFAPHARARLVDLATIVAADDALLTAQAAQALAACRLTGGAGWLRLDAAGWRALPTALQRRVLRAALRGLADNAQTAEISLRVLEQARAIALRGDVGQQAALPAGLRLVVEYDALLLCTAGVVPPHHAPQLLTTEAQPLRVPGELVLTNGWSLTARYRDEIDAAEITVNADRWQAYLAVAPGAPLTVRGRRAGEQMQPLGLGGRSAALKEIMIDRKLPATLRDRWPLLTADDAVIWLVGHVVGAQAAVTETAGRVLHVVCRPPAIRAESRQSDAA